MPMSVDTPAFYFHRKPNGKPGFQRQSGEAVRARSTATYKANPTLAKFTNALWAEKHPELRRLSASLWWQRNKHRPEVQEANRLKQRRLYARRKVYRSLRIV